MNKTALHQTHIDLGAKMIPFAGFEMPIRYSSDKEEHLCVRNAVGIFDVSHMGELIVTGEDATKFLQKMSSNNVEKLSIGQAQYAYLPNRNCGIVDDYITYKLEENKYMLVVNASNIEKVRDWLFKYKPSTVKISDYSSLFSLFAIQGPLAKKVLQTLTSINLDEIKFYHFAKGDIAKVEDLIISATGYTGEPGFEIYLPSAVSVDVWMSLLEAGKPYGIQPIGLGARDTLRLEMGYRLYGNDITEETNPLEAALGWATEFSTDFIGKIALLKSKEKGLSKRFRGIILKEKGIPRPGYKVYKGSKCIGIITSGSLSPSLNCGIGLAYLDKEDALIGNAIEVEIRGKGVKAEVASLPFYKKT